MIYFIFKLIFRFFIPTGLQKQLQAQGSHPQEPPGGKAAPLDPGQVRDVRNGAAEPHVFGDGGFGDVTASRMSALPQAVRLQRKAAAAPQEQAPGFVIRGF